MRVRTKRVKRFVRARTCRGGSADSNVGDRERGVAVVRVVVQAGSCSVQLWRAMLDGEPLHAMRMPMMS